MEYRKPTAEEFETVWSVIQDGRQALADLGIDQWQGPNPSYETIRNDVLTGLTRVAVEDGEILGCLAFCTGLEYDYEHNVISGQWPTGFASKYVALHRVATGKKAVRKGVCSFLFQEAMKEAKELGLEGVRVDTHAGNIRMQGALTKNGFTQCTEITLSDPDEPTKHRIGYERVVE